MPETDEIIPKKKKQILDTAIAVFSKYGSKRVSVEEICRKASVSKMTFYKYFSNKKALVLTIRDSWMVEGFEKFDQINALDLSFPEKIDLMTAWKVEFAARVNAKFIRELISNDDANEKFKHRFLRNLKNAQKKGEIRQDIDMDLVWLVIEKLSELFEQGVWKQVVDDYGEYQKQLRALLFYGLLTRKEEK